MSHAFRNTAPHRRMIVGFYQFGGNGSLTRALDKTSSTIATGMISSLLTLAGISARSFSFSTGIRRF